MTTSSVLKQQSTVKEFGKYLIKEELGRGGMGVVYKAYDPHLHRHVALKLILNLEKRNIDRFMIESKAMGQITHPNLVTIYEFGRDPQPYFAMEYIEGTTLEYLIREKKTKPLFVVNTMIKICDCLHTMHEQNILHRDIKPANIMIDHKGEPKLMDLGLAKFIQTESSCSGSGEDFLGTPAYMSPEQIAGKTKKASDVYAVGVTMYEALTHRKMFESDSATNLLYQVIHEDPTPVSKINPKVTSQLDKICQKCLQKDFKLRYQNCKQLQKALENFKKARKTQRVVMKKNSQNKWQKITLGVFGALLLVSFAISLFFYSSYKKLKMQNEKSVSDSSQNTANRKDNKTTTTTVLEQDKTTAQVPQNNTTLRSQKSSEQQKTAKQYFEQAVTAYKNNNAHKAIEYFSRAIMLNPEYEEAYESRGKIYLNINKDKEALADFERAIMLNKKANYFYNKAVALRKLQQNEQALIALNSALELNDKNSDYWEMRCLVNFSLKKEQQAHHDIDEAIKLNKTNAQHYSNKGAMYLHQKKYQEAMKYLNEAQKLNSKLDNVYYYKGEVYYMNKQYKRALQYFQQATKLNKTYAIAYSRVGDCCYWLGKYKLAIVSWRMALKSGYPHNDLTVQKIAKAEKRIK